MEGTDDENEMPSESFPPLKLYHNEQAMGQWQELYSKTEGIINSMQSWRIYRNLRFYESLMGFHTVCGGAICFQCIGAMSQGDLDLSGRHQERYTTLKTAWEEYLCDFAEVREIATPTFSEVDYGRGIIIKEVEYTFSNPGLWDNFQKKWKIHISTSVFGWTDDALEAMKQNPEPKIQSLCLQHLPVELIQQAYQMSTQQDARILSSTSRYMRSLALPYIFSARTIRLDPGHWYRAIPDPATCTREEVFARLQCIAVAGRDKSIETLKFVLSRSDLIKSLTSLSLLNLWAPDNQFDNTIAEGFRPTELDRNFYDPLDQYSYPVFRVTTNLTELRIMGFEITPEFVRITTQLPSLSTVLFNLCSLTSEVQVLVLEEDFPRYERVLNLSISFRSRSQEDDYIDPWFLLPLCPNVRNLTVQGSTSTTGIVLPPEDMQSALDPFKMLEKFAILGLVGWEVGALGRWIRGASGPGGHSIRMTHFKVEAKGSFGAMEMSFLVHALRFAPDLETCVFEGMRCEAAKTELVHFIARHLPNILGLTIVVNDKWHSHRSILRAWPSPMWAYGSLFSSFSRLQYFGWNNRFDHEISPAQMPFMEEGYPIEDRDGFMLLKTVNDESYVWDFERTGAVFGAYCPSLKAVALCDGQTPMITCSIERRDCGPVVESHDFGSPAMLGIRKWNTSLLLGW